MFILYLGPIPALEKIWIVGDEFMSRSFDQHFMQPDEDEFYTRENYDVFGFHTNQYMSNNPSMVSRIINQLEKAITEQVLLPKWLVIVLDDDLIKSVKYDKYGISDAYGRIINHIMVEHGRHIKSQKDYLPKKSKRPGIPGVIWIEAPNHMNFHNNDMREKFNKSMNSMAAFHDGYNVLQLKKIWEETNSNLYLDEYRRYTATGLAKSWLAVDHTIKYADTILLKKLQRKEKDNGNYKKYHWASKRQASAERTPRKTPVDSSFRALPEPSSKF